MNGKGVSSGAMAKKPLSPQVKREIRATIVTLKNMAVSAMKK
jgi:hypothetical protein